jgi:hypothetical protein
MPGVLALFLANAPDSILLPVYTLHDLLVQPALVGVTSDVGDVAETLWVPPLHSSWLGNFLDAADCYLLLDPRLWSCKQHGDVCPLGATVAELYGLDGIAICTHVRSLLRAGASSVLQAQLLSDNPPQCGVILWIVPKSHKNVVIARDGRRELDFAMLAIVSFDDTKTWSQCW